MIEAIRVRRESEFDVEIDFAFIGVAGRGGKKFKHRPRWDSPRVFEIKLPEVATSIRSDLTFHFDDSEPIVIELNSNSTLRILFDETGLVVLSR